MIVCIRLHVLKRCNQKCNVCHCFFVLLNTNKDILKNDLLVTNILQNIFILHKEIHTGLEKHEGE